MASEDFHITLSGAAKGLEQKYIDAWKYRFIACEDNDPSVNEEKLNQSVKKNCWFIRIYFTRNKYSTR